jgi:hypothetical protein
MIETDEQWADRMVALTQQRSQSVSEPSILPGSLWVAKDSARRGTIRWASGSRVCIAFSEHRHHETDRESFLRLYRPV